MSAGHKLRRVLQKLAPLLRAAPVDPDARRDYHTQLHESLLGKDGLLADNAALGILLAAGLEVGQTLYSRPGMQASVASALRELAGGDAEYSGDTSAADEVAERIVALLHVQRVKPVRLAVDGLPGSGKSTLAQKLAARLAMRWRNLDYARIDETLPLSDTATIYEHHRLLRTQPLDQFDALIYIDEPVDTVRQRILQRQRGGVLVDVMDFDKLKRIGDLAFELAAGDEYRIDNSPVRIKLRPSEGYRLRENVQARLGTTSVDTSALTTEELLFLITDAKAQSGFFAYVDASAWQRAALNGLAAALYHLSRRKHRR